MTAFQFFHNFTLQENRVENLLLEFKYQFTESKFALGKKLYFQDIMSSTFKKFFSSVCLYEEILTESSLKMNGSRIQTRAVCVAKIPTNFNIRCRSIKTDLQTIWIAVINNSFRKTKSGYVNFHSRKVFKGIPNCRLDSSIYIYRVFQLRKTNSESDFRCGYLLIVRGSDHIY